MFLILLLYTLINLTSAYEELKGIIDKRFEENYTDTDLEKIVDEALKSKKYDIMLELRIRDLLERAQTSAEREYYAYLLVKYTQDINLLTSYGQHITPEGLVRLCRDDLKTKNTIERYKRCFEVHKDGRFFRGIYAVMDLKDRDTRRWMEIKITEVKLYKEYAYHAMGLMYYHLNEIRKSMLFLNQAGRLGLASLAKIHINIGDLQKAKEYADKIRTYKDLTDEEREVLRFVDRNYKGRNH